MLFPSLNFERFLTLLKNAKSIIGNSSAGVREAPFYGVPTINIGTRQNNRIAKLDSIINVTYEESEIAKAIDMISSKNIKFNPIEHFGSGNSDRLFKKLLLSEKFWSIPKQKHFNDI